MAITKSEFKIIGLEEFKAQCALFGFDMSDATDQVSMILVNETKRLCPVDSGDLQKSIKPYRQSNFVGGAMTDLYYGVFVNNGTQHITARHFFEAALNGVTTQLEGVYAAAAQRQLDQKIKPVKVAA